MKEFNLKISDNGDVATEEVASEKTNGIAEIVKLLGDPGFNRAQVNRLIAVEIAKATLEIARLSADAFIEAGNINALSQQVRALRELGKQVDQTQ